MKVALYARVSTTDKNQNPEAQLHELRRFCEYRKWTHVTEFVDEDTGSRADREQLELMRASIREKHFDVVVCWKMDRIFRSVKFMLQFLEECAEGEAQFISLQEAIDQTTPTGRFNVVVLAGVAALEREVLSERVKMGLAYAKSQGRVLGRPKTRDDLAIHRLKRKGYSYREIMSELGCSMGAVGRALK